MVGELSYPVRYNGKYVFLDSEGKLRKKPSFDYIKEFSFSDGYCAFINVMNGKNKRKWTDGYISKNGKVIHLVGYDEVNPFKEGMSKVRRGDLYGFIDLDIKESIDCKYEEASCFSEELACVSKDGKYGYIDRDENIIIDFKYERAERFSCGRALVETADDKFFIDRNENYVFGLEYGTYASDFFEDNALRIWDESFKYGYLNKNGELITPFKFDSANNFSEGYASVKLGDKWGFIDKNGEMVINPKYGYASSFKNGLAVVAVMDDLGVNRWGYINKDGVEVIPVVFDSCESFLGEYAQVSRYGDYFYIDKKGNRVF